MSLRDALEQPLLGQVLVSISPSSVPRKVRTATRPATGRQALVELADEFHAAEADDEDLP